MTEGVTNGLSRDRIRELCLQWSCSSPELAMQLLDALATTVARTEGQHPAVRAAVASFGFVYIHPFVDGNGRILRYLIHDMLVREAFTPPGFIFPVSAVILKRLVDYMAALEGHSEPVLRLAEYHFDPRASTWGRKIRGCSNRSTVTLISPRRQCS